MRRFYFDLITPDEREEDLLGILVADLDQAYLEACRGVVEIARDALLGHPRADPAAYRFEIFDQHRKLLLEVPFREVLNPRADSAGRPMQPIMESLRRNLDRNQALRVALAAELDQARQRTSGMLDRLGHSRSE